MVITDIGKYEVEADELRWYCDSEEFEFDTTQELKEPEKLEEIVKGQEIAKKQLKDAIRLRQNAILVGPPGCGKSLLASMLAKQYSAEVSEKVALQDQLLAHNFDDSFEPLALRLPTPKGFELRDDLNQLVNDIKAGKISEEKLTKQKRKDVKEGVIYLERLKENRYKALEGVRRDSKKYYEIAPRATKEEAKAFEDLLEEMLQQETPHFVLRHPRNLRISKEQAEEMFEGEIQEINSEIERLTSLLEQKRPGMLTEKYAEYPKVKQFLEKIVKDLKENPPPRLPPHIQQMAMMTGQNETEKKLEEYRVNLIVNNSDTKGLPVQFIENPTIQNMIGDVQHDPYGLGGRKPHMRAKAGKLPKANGGIAIIDELVTVFKNPILSDYLLTALEEREVRIGGGHGLIGGGTSAGIETQPVEADCVIIGCANEDIRQYTTPKMARRFKHKILFDANMDNTEENRIAYANFIAHEIREYNKDEKNREKIPNFSRDGVAAIVEEGARFATRFENSDKKKHLTNVLDAMKDIVQKAGLKALDKESNTVTKEHVEEAVSDMRRPAIKEQTDYVEKVKNGAIILHTQGREVGYINGLVVYPDPFKTEFFGFPARLEAIDSAGTKGLISITEKSGLSKKVFTKGHEDIIGYFKKKYEQDMPKYYEGRLDFNQLYNPLEGDSASIATAMVYLSTFSNIPIKQSIAVTGSMNQRGDVQAVGGVNEKIEGFYRLCKEQGLLEKAEDEEEDYGVIIPKSNVQSLMLDKGLIEDVKKGRFHIYPISTLDEAIEILTRQPAEEVHKKVREKLEEYTKGYQQVQRREEK